MNYYFYLYFSLKNFVTEIYFQIMMKVARHVEDTILEELLVWHMIRYLQGIKNPAFPKCVKVIKAFFFIVNSY